MHIANSLLVLLFVGKIKHNYASVCCFVFVSHLYSMIFCSLVCTCTCIVLFYIPFFRLEV